MPYLLHTLTKKRIDAFMNTPSHALLLEGAIGSGTQHALAYIQEIVAKKRHIVHTIEPEKSLFQ